MRKGKVRDGSGKRRTANDKVVGRRPTPRWGQKPETPRSAAAPLRGAGAERKGERMRHTGRGS